MKRPGPLSEESLWRDWRALCAGIGERRAGSEAEARAAAYIAGEFAAAGLEGVRTETFPCLSLRNARTSVGVCRHGRWHRTECSPFVGAPGTPAGRPVEGEIVWLPMPESARRLTPGCLQGKVAVLFGPLPEREEHHRSLVRAAPLAVLQVDERLPFPWVKSDGVYPWWTRRHGMPPTVAVPYLAAWEWRQGGVRRARVQVRVDQVRTRSQNVIGELPGRNPGLPAIAVTAHHDTQCGNPGADDNASGVVCVLALARWLARRRCRRTVRFITFGAEEQLSVGAAAHVRRHRRELRRLGLIMNFDSVSSPLGHFELACIGRDGLGRLAARVLARHGVDTAVSTRVTPFVDNFPFNRAGVPSLCFMRPNCAGGGRWQHHSRHDNLDNVSGGVVAELLAGAAPLLSDLAARKRWPFGPGLPPAQRREALRLGRELLAPEIGS